MTNTSVETPQGFAKATRWLVRLFVVLLLIGVAAGAYAVYSGVNFVKSIADQLSTDTTLTARPETTADGVRFQLQYGGESTGLVYFIISDPVTGEKLWELRGHGQNKQATIQYGVVPQDEYNTWQQTFPENNAAPLDIRGQRVQLEMNWRFQVAFGPGHQMSRTEIDIPK